MQNKNNESTGPRILFLDIETRPMLGYVWDLWDQNIALNQIKDDWCILAFAAKWADSDTVIYFDQSETKNKENDTKLLKEIWKLLDEADIVVGQNSKKFDIKKINARFALNGFKPPSSYRQLDTLQIARKHFAFSSNKLEYLSENLCKVYKKLKHSKFGGFDLWKACLADDPQAWEEMKKYNINDVLSTEELFNVLKVWDNTINYSVYYGEHICKCGSKEFKKNGFAYTNSGKYQRYCCKKCNSEHRDKQNLLKKEK